MLKTFKQWCREEKAVIALEMGLLLPVMVTILLGVMDTGMSVLTSQKVVNSAQMVGDLLGREITVSTATLNNTVEAGKLMLMPYDTTSYGVDIAGIQFVGSPTNPNVIWRYTVNMSPNPDILLKANNLGNDQEGVLGVTVEYTFTPYFSGVFTGPVVLSEVSYARGRNGLFIPRV